MGRTYYSASAIPPDDGVLICAGDVETAGFGGELLSIQWGYMGKVFIDTGPEKIKNFFDCFLSMPKPAVWFFHFGQYDWRYFLEYFRTENLITEICLRTETDIYEIRVKRNKEDAWSILRDSYALWPHKLKELANSFCPEIPKLEVDIEHFDPTNEEHIKYAKRDVEILLLGLPRLFDLLEEHFHIHPSATTAGTAMRGWQRTLRDGKYYDGSLYSEKELFIRDGYYGGLVFLTNNILNRNCITYDRNSSYPASMLKHGVPCGKPMKTSKYEEDFPGIYRVRVKAPDDLIIPILPARNIKGAMRWYRGTFDTVVTTQELIFAAKHGYEIQEIYEGYFFESIEFPFNDFINLCREIRIQYKGKPEEILAKLMQNSLYGRFCARRERNRILTGDLTDEELSSCKPLDEFGYFYIKKELDEKLLCLPQWGVFITANSRLALLEQCYNIGPENVIYGDTDSITIKSGNEHGLDIGNDYGQWKREKEWDVFRAIAPKVYVGILGADFKGHKKGSFMGAAKGLPQKGINDKNWHELLEYGETRAATASLDSLRIAMKNGVKPSRQLTRISSSLDNSQNFVAVGHDVRVKYPHGQDIDFSS
jgi:hypothetical protein